MFWGFLFLAIGVVIIIQHVFNIDLPILKILFGLFLIYLGLKIIFGSFGMRMNAFRVDRVSTGTEAIFSEALFKARSSESNEVNSKFSTAFGSSTLDLTDLTPEELAGRFKISNAFGKTKVKTNPEHGIKAHISVGFGSVKIRGENQGALGEINYKSENYKSQGPNLQLDIDNAFGEVEIE